MSELSFLKSTVEAISEAPTATDLRNAVLALGLDPTGKSTDEMMDVLALSKWAARYPDKPFPDQYDPMLAKDATKSPREWLASLKSSDWIIQIKKNGVRSVIQMGQGSLKMTSRNRSVVDYMRPEQQDWVLGFQKVSDPFKGKTVIDGELLCKDKVINTGDTITASQLQAVVALIHMEPTRSLEIQKKIGSLEYHAFDIMWLNGEDLTGKSYADRVTALDVAFGLLKQANPDLPFFLVETVTDFQDASAVYQKYIDQGEEGVMLKSRSGKYRYGARSSDILKYKRLITVDGWVSGFVPADPAKGNKNLIGALEVSSYVDGKPRVVANVSGLDAATRSAATKIVDGKVALNPEFLDKVLEVEGNEWSKNGRLVHARIGEQGFRDDKRKDQCQLTSDDIKPQQ